MPRRRKSSNSWWLWLAAACAVTIAAAAVFFALTAERKLSTLVLGGIGESFSTKIWSAPFRMDAGARLESERLIARLERLGYRGVSGVPSKGEYRWVPPELTVYLRGFAAPDSEQIEGIYILRQASDSAWSLLDGLGAAVSSIHLEPEIIAELSDEKSQRREPASWDQLPPSLRDAVVAVEDKRFWKHFGIDPRAVARAMLSNLRGRDLQGASTITQQLSKNLFLSPQRTLSRKIAEAAMALYLELRLDKRRILTLYLNTIYLGQDGPASVMGARSAARYYFGKDVTDLSLAESALIAGVIRGPGVYNPYRDLRAALARRNHVLGRMRDEGMISPGDYATAAATPIDLSHQNSSSEDRRDSAYYTAEVVRQLVPRYGGDSLYRHGLSVYTSMDPVLQGLARKALKPARHQAAIVVLNPKDGAVLALCGGRDFGESQFNRATQAQRQPGSAFKPFVYATALSLGLTPATVLRDRPKTYRGEHRDWSPSNYDGIYHGTATMRQALMFSLNAATLDLAERVGIQRIIKTAKACGITSPLREDLGLALGASEVGLLELAAAYIPFAHGGQRISPRLITSVVDSEGLVLERTAPEISSALDPATSFLTTSLLESVVQDGTARSAKKIGVTFPAAGKTGTTNDGRDAWFVGYTASLLAGVWVGDDKNRALRLTGAKDALPLWAAFMKDAGTERPGESFTRPDNVVETLICLDSGMLARSGCPQKRTEVFLAGTQPQRDCALHQGGFSGWLKKLLGRD